MIFVIYFKVILTIRNIIVSVIKEYNTLFSKYNFESDVASFRFIALLVKVFQSSSLFN